MEEERASCTSRTPAVPAGQRRPRGPGWGGRGPEVAVPRKADPCTRGAATGWGPQPWDHWVHLPQPQPPGAGEPPHSEHQHPEHQHPALPQLPPCSPIAAPGSGFTPMSPPPAQGSPVSPGAGSCSYSPRAVMLRAPLAAPDEPPTLKAPKDPPRDGDGAAPAPLCPVPSPAVAEGTAWGQHRDPSSSCPYRGPCPGTGRPRAPGTAPAPAQCRRLGFHLRSPLSSPLPVSCLHFLLPPSAVHADEPHTGAHPCRSPAAN